MPDTAATVSPVLETDPSWHVTRDGEPVASVAVRREGGQVVVDTTLKGDGSGHIDPCRFPSLQAADAFISDLISSFSYLGCDVSRA